MADRKAIQLQDGLGNLYDIKDAEARGEIDTLKSAINAVTDTETYGGKNMFDPQYLGQITGWSVDEGVYSGTLSNLASAYGSAESLYPITEQFEAITQYTFSCKAYTNNEKSGTGNGLMVYIAYTDNTNSSAGLANSTSSYASLTITSTSGKTVAGVYLKYANKGTNVWYIKEVQLEKGATATTYEPYGTSYTETVIDTDAINGYNDIVESVENLNGIYETGYTTGKNKFDSQYMLVGTSWTESEGVYSGVLNNLLAKYGTSTSGYPIHERFKENTRYTFSCKGYTTNTASGTGSGFMVQFNYTDGTNSSVGISNSTNSFADFSVTSSSDKTVQSIAFKYGSKPENTWYLKEIQIEAGADATEYAAYTETSFDAVKPGAIQDASISRNKLSFNPNDGFTTNSFPVQLFEIPYPESDMTYVGNELWGFGSSADDHSSYAGIKRYIIDYDNGSYTYTTIFHNWGHINSIDYSRGADALITSNAGQSTTDEGVIYIVQNASALKELADQAQAPFSTYVTQIDCSGLGLGYKFQLCWGESNNGRYDIVYLFTNEMEKLRRIQLGKGENELTYGTMISGALSDEFNGTFDILNEFDTNIHMQNNGTAYYHGHIYAVGDHTAKYVLKFTPDVSGAVLIDRYKEVCRNASGAIASPVIYGEGIALHNGYMAYGTGLTIGIYEAL